MTWALFISIFALVFALYAFFLTKLYNKSTDHFNEAKAAQFIGEYDLARRHREAAENAHERAVRWDIVERVKGLR